MTYEPPARLTVAQYRGRVLAGVAPVSVETVALQDAHGRVLARDVASRLPQPAFTNAAMDGYAVRARDTLGATSDRPVSLPVVGESAAGAPRPHPLPDAAALRIMTGAPVPAGADSVVPVERTTEEAGRVRIRQRAEPGDHVRLAGEELPAGAPIASRGTAVGAAQLALLAASGVSTVSCHRRVRVVVLSTGDELVPIGAVPGDGQLHDSNGPMLVARLVEEGATAENHGPIADDPALLRAAIRDAVSTADLVLVTGGVSAGRYDHLPAVVGELGEATRAEVALRPGKPQLHGVVGGRTVLGLPGNPVAAFVSFELFALPVVRRLQGGCRTARTAVWATAGAQLRGSSGRQTFVRVQLETTAEGLVATPTDGQRSHMLGGLAAAHGLAEVPPDQPVLDHGAAVRVHLLTAGW